jgi:hypothetical protein
MMGTSKSIETVSESGVACEPELVRGLKIIPEL